MDPAITGALISGAASLYGGRMASDANSQAGEKNAAMQREFAQHGVRWRVEDAKKAGIHPLAALGFQAPQAAPSYLGDTSMGSAVASMGQDIGRAVSSTRTSAEKEMAALQLQNAKTELEGKTLDNAIRANRLKQLQMSAPSFPSAEDNFIPGQGNSGGLMKVKPAERTASQPGRLAQEAGWRPDVSFARTDTGLTPMVPEALSESLEDDHIGKLMWRARNQLGPNLYGTGAPPLSQLPKGFDKWMWHHLDQEWRPIKSSGGWKFSPASGFTFSDR